MSARSPRRSPSRVAPPSRPLPPLASSPTHPTLSPRPLTSPPSASATQRASLEELLARALSRLSRLGRLGPEGGARRAGPSRRAGEPEGEPDEQAAAAEPSLIPLDDMSDSSAAAGAGTPAGRRAKARRAEPQLGDPTDGYRTLDEADEAEAGAERGGGEEAVGLEGGEVAAAD